MKTSFRSILAILFSLLFIASCSRKKDNFVSRNFHAVATEYNTLYNGYIALDQGRELLNEAYQDNYWDILPIERMQIDDEVALPGQSDNENFNRAEEKAVKAVQKHGMNIKDKERNPQIDEAYLLLGKARYFDQRFVPSLEAFNYILYKYPASDKINQAKIWREKANIRLENDELAIKNLKRLLDQEELKDQDLADATSMLAQAFLNTKQIDSAIAQLEIASKATKSNDERGRYLFIQGQLYNKVGHKDSANIAFDKIIELNRKTPRIYLISAHLEKAKNFDYDNGNKLQFLELLTDLEENRENRPYLDKIYHQIAEYHIGNGSDSLAVVYYSKSLRAPSQDKVLKARNYQILGDMSFDNSLYSVAGAYYDSTMTNLVLNSKPYRRIKRKRENLEDVIYYENIAQANDSILRLVNLSEVDKLIFFESYIDRLKEQAALEKEEQEKQEAVKRNSGVIIADKKLGNNNQTRSLNKRGLPNVQVSSFYFYNQTTVAYGKNEFVKVWGDRPLDDDWRWSNKSRSGTGNNAQTADAFVSATEEELFDPQFYVAQIPSEEKEIDSISKERNFAYYQLGLIYKEKFKEYGLAKNKLQELLKSNPEERLVLPAKYNLYKIYELLGQNDEATIAKNDIISNYPESRYATILNNPELAALKDENSPESLYEKLYAQHKDQEYAEVISKCDDFVNVFEGDAIVPKFELLKAIATGRLYGYEAYAKAISFVALNYPNSPEGRQAEDISNNVLPKIDNKEFVVDDALENFKAVYQFTNATPEAIDDFVKKLSKIMLNSHYRDNKVISVDVYSSNTTFVLVHDLESADEAGMFNLLVREEDRNKVAKPDFVISSANYQTIQIHKNLEAYLNISNN